MFMSASGVGVGVGSVVSMPILLFHHHHPSVSLASSHLTMIMTTIMDRFRFRQGERNSFFSMTLIS